MSKMEDIYYNVDSYIVENNFYKSGTEEQKELVDRGLKQYLAKKIHEIDKTKTLTEEQFQQVDVIELVELLSEMIPTNLHGQTLEHIVRYLLGSISLVQGKKVKWIKEDNDELIDSTHFEFNEKQQVTILKTHTTPSYVQTIKFIYDIYRSGLLHKKGKEYQKKKEQ